MFYLILLVFNQFFIILYIFMHFYSISFQFYSVLFNFYSVWFSYTPYYSIRCSSNRIYSILFNCIPFFQFIQFICIQITSISIQLSLNESIAYVEQVAFSTRHRWRASRANGTCRWKTIRFMIIPSVTAGATHCSGCTKPASTSNASNSTTSSSAGYCRSRQFCGLNCGWPCGFITNGLWLPASIVLKRFRY